MNLYPKSQHIVVLGAGYGGLPCVLKLAHAMRSKSSLGAKTHITLVNAEPRQELTCELFRALRTGVSESFSFLPALKRAGVDFLEGTVSSIQPAEKTLQVRGENRREFRYDHLVLAAGSKARLPELNGLKEAMELSEQNDKRIFLFRNNVQVQALRLALKRIGWGPDKRASKDVFVVILGAGTTGLEVAGEIAALRGKNRRARVIVVDQKSGLLEGFSPVAKRVLKRELGRLGIETVLGSPATAISERELKIKNGQVIPWDLMILSTGSRPSLKLTEKFGDAATPQGLRVKRNLQVEGFMDHYAIGDAALIPRSLHELGNISYLPKLAQFAVQQGHFVAKLLEEKIIDGQNIHSNEFEATDLGQLVSLGPYAGFGRIGPEVQNPLGRFLSPFVTGPIVDQLKRASRMKYITQLKWDSLHLL